MTLRPLAPEASASANFATRPILLSRQSLGQKTVSRWWPGATFVTRKSCASSLSPTWALFKKVKLRELFFL